MLSAVPGPIFTFRYKKITPAPGGNPFPSSDTLPSHVQKIFRKSRDSDTAIAVFMGDCPRLAASGRSLLQGSAPRCYRAVHTPVSRLRIDARATITSPAFEVMSQGRRPPRGRQSHALARSRRERAAGSIGHSGPGRAPSKALFAHPGPICRKKKSRTLILRIPDADRQSETKAGPERSSRDRLAGHGRAGLDGGC